MTRYTPRLGAMSELEDSAAMDRMLEYVGEQVADTARPRAPRESGAGADGIQGVVGHDNEGPHVDVSWLRDNFYMGFSETGTEHQTPTPFLVPGLQATRI